MQFLKLHTVGGSLCLAIMIVGAPAMASDPAARSGPVRVSLRNLDTSALSPAQRRVLRDESPRAACYVLEAKADASEMQMLVADLARRPRADLRVSGDPKRVAALYEMLADKGLARDRLRGGTRPNDRIHVVLR